MAWQRCEAEREAIAGWLKEDVPVVKIADLLGRRGVVVPERTLHRFCAEELGIAVAGRRCRWPMASRVRSCRSTSVGWAISPTGRGVGGWCAR